MGVDDSPGRPDADRRYAERVLHISGAWQRAARGAGLLSPDGALAPTIFAEITAAAVRHDAVNLGQGFPDEDGPIEVLDAATEAIRSGVNQYPPGRGMPVLRDAIADHQHRFYGIDLDPEREILVTAGATEALTAALLALLDGPEDEVVVFEPYYDSYAAAIALAGARLVPVPLRWPALEPDLDDLRAAVTDRTRIILVNDPHNPTGTMFTADVRQEIVLLAERHDALIVTDEVYEHLVMGAAHTPISTLPGAAGRTLTISSGGKTFRTTGWKVGWVSGPADLVDAVLAVKQYLTYVNGAPFQPAIAVGLGLPDTYFDDLAATQRERRRLRCEHPGRVVLHGGGCAPDDGAGRGRVGLLPSTARTSRGGCDPTDRLRDGGAPRAVLVARAIRRVQAHGRHRGGRAAPRGIRSLNVASATLSPAG